MRNGNLFWGWGESPKIGFTKSLAPLFIQMSGLHAPTVYFLTTHGSLNFPRGDHQWCLNYMMFLSIPHPTPPPHVLALTVLNILSNVEHCPTKDPWHQPILPFPLLYLCTCLLFTPTSTVVPPGQVRGLRDNRQLLTLGNWLGTSNKAMCCSEFIWNSQLGLGVLLSNTNNFTERQQ